MSGTAPRRDNGLRAASYEQVADVETHLVEDLLDRLRAAGIPAYSAPATGRRGPYGETVPPPAPLDTVWVDADQRQPAGAVVQRYLADVADDLAWAGIVADFDRVPADAVPPWPVSEDVEPGAEAPTDLPSPPPAPATRREEDHFEPPPPPPLPTFDTVSRFAWAGALGGPAVLLLATMAGIPLAGWVGGLAVAAFMAGFVTLVARMKDAPPTDTGPDDGAVV